MTPPSLYLAGVAAFLPPRVSADEAVRRGWYAAEGLADGWTGAAVAGDLAPAEMATRASATALRRSGLTATDIDIVFYGSSLPQGPHAWCPQQYVERRVIGRDVPAVDLRQGCTAILSGLDLAAGYLAVPGRHGALVTGADNFGFDPAYGEDPALRWRYGTSAATNRASILGDAGSAAVVSNRTGFARILSIVARSLSDLEEAYRGGEPLFPPSYSRERPFRLGERFAAYDRADPGALAVGMDRLRDARTDLARQVLDEAGVAPGQVSRVLHVHAGNDRYLKHLLDPLGIDPARGMLEFGRAVGHLGVNDQLAGLEHLVLSGQTRPGDHLLMMSNGVGASLACALVEILEQPVWTV